jgi:hypothetical protein
MSKLNEERCPYCFSLFSDHLWTHDPILTLNGSKFCFDDETGKLVESESIEKRYHKGFYQILNSDIKELQEEYDDYKPENGWTPVEDSADGLWVPNKKHIRELREAIEEALEITEASTETERQAILEEYFNYDENGTERVSSAQHQKEWTDSTLTNTTEPKWQGQIKNLHIEELRHSLIIRLERWNKSDNGSFMTLWTGDIGKNAWNGYSYNATPHYVYPDIGDPLVAGTVTTNLTMSSHVLLISATGTTYDVTDGNGKRWVGNNSVSSWFRGTWATAPKITESKSKFTVDFTFTYEKGVFTARYSPGGSPYTSSNGPSVVIDVQLGSGKSFSIRGVEDWTALGLTEGWNDFGGGNWGYRLNIANMQGTLAFSLFDKYPNDTVYSVTYTLSQIGGGFAGPVEEFEVLANSQGSFSATTDNIGLTA